MNSELKVIVKENTWMKSTHFTLDHGWGNGYVLLPADHPYHGAHYDEIPVEVHGGLTFSTEVDEVMVEDWPELSKEDIGGWLVGFDTAHAYDTISRWPKENVVTEAEQLRDQLSLAAQMHTPAKL